MCVHMTFSFLLEFFFSWVIGTLLPYIEKLSVAREFLRHLYLLLSLGPFWLGRYATTPPDVLLCVPAVGMTSHLASSMGLCYQIAYCHYPNHRNATEMLSRCRPLHFTARSISDTPRCRVQVASRCITHLLTGPVIALQTPRRRLQRPRT